MSYQKTIAIWLMGLAATTPVFAQPDGSAGQPSVSGTLNFEDSSEYGEELLRGPVHEAFAEQYNQDPIDGVVIDRAPPEVVNEIPPEIRPEGDNVEWLSGYWFWDDDRGDFLWVSGTWRVIPPGHRWLPGYWAQSGDQYQWVSGSWVSTQREAIEYIAQSPPESLDRGPVGVAPSENHFWIPGCWSWAQNDYAWRPGYWSGGYSNWVWVPERYLWTPRGYVFCNGYWDYPIARRGTLFAPFYFSQPVYARSGFFYSPRVSILASLLQSHFWVRPRYQHYYFGDFYASNYRNVGIIPWHSFHRGVGFQSQRYTFDPLFVHASLYNRSGGGNFYQQINNQYNVFVNQSDRRPSRTYRDQEQRGDRGRSSRDGFGDDRFNRGLGTGDRNESFLGESIGDLAQRDPNRFTRLTSDQLTRIRNESADVPRLATLRRENELTPGRGAPGRTGDRRGAGDSASLADRLQLPPVVRDRSGRDGQRAQSPDRSRSEGRYSSGRPSTDRPDIDRPDVDRPGIDRPDIDRPGIDRPGIDRPGTDRPGIDRPGIDRPATDRPGIDRPGTDRPGTDRPGIDRPSIDRPSIDGPGIDGPGNNRPGTDRPDTDRPSIDRPGSDRPNVGRPSFDRPGVDRPSINRPSTGQPSADRPGIGRPSVDRPSTNRPSIGRPGTAGPGTDGPNTQRPGAERPSFDRPNRGTGSDSPPSGSRLGDPIGVPSPLRTQPSPTQPNRSLPGIGTSPIRPQIGVPSSKPLRTPGAGERPSGRLGSQMLTPNNSGRPSLNRSDRGDSGRPSPSLAPSPSSRAPVFGGGALPSPRSVGPAASNRPQFTPSTEGRPQLAPRTGGGLRPEAGQSLRGNRGGGSDNRGPGNNSRGKRD